MEIIQGFDQDLRRSALIKLVCFHFLATLLENLHEGSFQECQRKVFLISYFLVYFLFYFFALLINNCIYIHLQGKNTKTKIRALSSSPFFHRKFSWLFPLLPIFVQVFPPSTFFERNLDNLYFMVTNNTASQKKI